MLPFSLGDGVSAGLEAHAYLAGHVTADGSAALHQQCAVMVYALGDAGEGFVGELQANGLAGDDVPLLPFLDERCEALGLELLQGQQQLMQQQAGQFIARHALAQGGLHVYPGLVDLGARRRRHTHVEADADHHADGAVGFAGHFQQGARQFSAVPDHVVGPLEADILQARLAQGAGHGDTADQSQSAEYRGTDGETPQQREIDAGRIGRHPTAAAPSPA